MKPAAIALSWTFLVASAGLAAAGPGRGPASAGDVAAPRPLILLVHGRGHAGLDTAALRQRWQRSLDAGIAAVAGDSPLRDGDVALVWYADALDPLSAARCTSEQTRGQASMAAADESLAALVSLTSIFLAAVTETVEGPGARELRNFAGDLQFFGDPRKRCAAEGQLARALGDAARAGRPVVLVAHSMGAVLSWSHLANRDTSAGRAVPVRRLVTIGSPVGSAEVRALLTGIPGTIGLPAGVARWINVVDERDPFAVRLGAAATGLGDVLTREAASADPHAIERYLRDPATIEAAIGGWCDAFARGEAPRECSRL